MTFDLKVSLPFLVPKAVAWAEAQAIFITQSGQPLDDALLAVARKVGVVNPERIRIVQVSSLPLPEDSELRAATQATGLFSPNMVGLTLGHGLYICHGHHNLRLLSHEFRHVHQYEAAGSIAAFLPIYLQQIAAFGYHNAPFEVDARAHELHHA